MIYRLDTNMRTKADPRVRSEIRHEISVRMYSIVNDVWQFLRDIVREAIRLISTPGMMIIIVILVLGLLTGDSYTAAM